MSNKGTSASEIIFIICLIVGLLLPFILVKLWWWAVMMAIIALTVGLTELISKFVTGKTISQQFWIWSSQKDESGKLINRWKAYGVVAGLMLGWMGLMWHLLAKLI